ncbi:MAG: HPr(Ser) kinase/phosphatase [Acidobacteria bacterium SCN 69-37]|nr:MAG: HPr(Ser) kinase/phosphatase [Acidobacteria bacterium SCN 69-37]
MSAGVSVGTLVGLRGEASGLSLDVLAGAAGLERRITMPFLQRMGLALAGVDEFLRPGRALIFGESEIRFLERMDVPARRTALAAVFAHDLPCVVLTAGLEPLPELIDAAETTGIPLLRSSLVTAMAMARLTMLLEDRLAPSEVQHGVLLDVLGLGVMVTGESGIGKSECALDLVVRGHRLVADDTVEIRCRGGAILVGRCPEFTRHHMEIRGLGIVNVTDLFGVSATRTSKRIELVVRLERWDSGREYDRLGLESERIDVLGVAVPLVTIPVATARNLAMLVEVAVRTHLLRSRGRHAARLLASRLEQRLEALAERPQNLEAEEP